MNRLDAMREEKTNSALIIDVENTSGKRQETSSGLTIQLNWRKAYIAGLVHFKMRLSLADHDGLHSPLATKYQLSS